MNKANNEICILHQAGMLQPLRIIRLIEETIGFFNLNLSGLTVLTEAASGPYAVTPVIAAMAGAENVLALTRDSLYSSAQNVISQTRALEKISGIQRKIDIYTDRELSLFSQADIVTNLGFVRPIDSHIAEVMKPTAAVPLMCESWEFRPGDVDLETCKNKGIVVLGTDEDFEGLNVFDYSGWLCIKMLLDAQIEIHKSRIILISGDKFGKVIDRMLKKSGILVSLRQDLKNIQIEELESCDALIVADYQRKGMIIGPNGDMTASDIMNIAPDLTIIQFAGKIDVLSLEDCNIAVYPGHKTLGSTRMALTLSEIGPRPVIELHAAGLKVGESIARARLEFNLSPNKAIEYSLKNSPAQLVSI